MSAGYDASRTGHPLREANPRNFSGNRRPVGIVAPSYRIGITFDVCRSAVAISMWTGSHGRRNLRRPARVFQERSTTTRKTGAERMAREMSSMKTEPAARAPLSMNTAPGPKRSDRSRAN